MAGREQTVQDLRDLREEIEQTKIAIDHAERDYDLNRAAELRYGKLAGLEEKFRTQEDLLSQKQSQSCLLKEEVSEDDVAAVVSRWTGIPVQRILEGEMEKLSGLEEDLHLRVVGQDEAVGAVADAVVRARAGLKDPHRPVGSFIFLGPTGVGKTELARSLAEVLFDDEKAMIRIDMSEYQEKHTISRLVGAPPGYVGFDDGGQLTEAVRRRPYSVILFDEVAKAHFDVFNLLLQVLDDGRLTDSKGRTVDFKNTILIMTSNVGSHRILEYQGQLEGEDYQRMQETVLAELRGHFRPEFLNRVDELIVFHGLSQEHLREIVKIQLSHLRARLAERSIELALDTRSLDYLAEVGYDPHYGARPVKRAIQKLIENEVSRQIVAGQIRDGAIVRVNHGIEGLEFAVDSGGQQAVREEISTAE